VIRQSLKQRTVDQILAVGRRYHCNAFSPGKAVQLGKQRVERFVGIVPLNFAPDAANAIHFVKIDDRQRPVLRHIPQGCKQRADVFLGVADKAASHSAGLTTKNRATRPVMARDLRHRRANHQRLAAARPAHQQHAWTGRSDRIRPLSADPPVPRTTPPAASACCDPGRRQRPAARGHFAQRVLVGVGLLQTIENDAG